MLEVERSFRLLFLLLLIIYVGRLTERCGWIENITTGTPVKLEHDRFVF